MMEIHHRGLHWAMKDSLDLSSSRGQNYIFFNQIRQSRAVFMGTRPISRAPGAYVPLFHMF